MSDEILRPTPAEQAKIDAFRANFKDTRKRRRARIERFRATGSWYPEGVVPRPQERYGGLTAEQWFFQRAYPHKQVLNPLSPPRTLRNGKPVSDKARGRRTLDELMERGVMPCPPLHQYTFHPTPGIMTPWTDIQPYRRIRSVAEDFDTLRAITANLPRYISHPIPACIYQEVDARVARGLDRRFDRRATYLGTTSDLRAGKLPHIKTPASKWIDDVCPACRQPFIRRTHQNYRTCSTRCTRALHAYAYILIHQRPPTRWRPLISFDLRLQFFSTNRLPSPRNHWKRTAASLIRSLADIGLYFMADKGPLAQSPSLTHNQITAVNDRISDIMSRAVTDAADVLSGKKKWDTNQTKLFLGLLNKVVPDAPVRPAPASAPPRTINGYPVGASGSVASFAPTQMTREELEALAAHADPVSDDNDIDPRASFDNSAPTIDAEPNPPQPYTPDDE